MSTPYEFKRFIPRKRPQGEPMATIGSKGNLLTLNRRAYDILGKPATVEVHFDEKRKVIGLRPAKASDTDAYTAQHKGG